MERLKCANLTCISLQNYGGLLVIDKHLNIVGISANALDLIDGSTDQYIGSSMTLFFKVAFKALHIKLFKFVKGILLQDLPKQIITLRMDKVNYYFKCKVNKELLYLEWEPQQKKHLSSAKLNEISFLLDRSYPNKWNMICQAVNSFINFERVVVLQVFETGHSQLIAEDKKGDIDFGLHKVFAENFMTEEALTYYHSAAYRYVPDLPQRANFSYDTHVEFEPLCTQLAPLPLMHEAYFTSLGFKSVICFPLIVNEKFWGLVIGYHTKEKIIDLQKRKLCAFFVQNAASKYESTVKQHMLEKKEHLNTIENTIKERLHIEKSLNCTIINLLPVLLAMTHSDGVAVYNEGEFYHKGVTPSQALFTEIIAYLKKRVSKSIFKDHNFKLNHGHHFTTPLNFAGLLAYQLDNNSEYYIVWFRKEKKTKITNIDAVQKPITQEVNAESKAIQVSETMIRNTAIPWNDEDLDFVHTLASSINESIIHRAKEKERMSEELETMNNELEMFTFTLAHDLKNPLSILGSGLHFLQQNSHTISQEKLNLWHKNLSANIDNITDIIDNIVFLSQNKIKAFTKDPIPMYFSIRKIVQETITLYESKNCQVVYGKLYPIWGEKSALYQVFVNVIGNAIKYSSSTEVPKISIKSSLEQDHVHYTIKDNGIGIPKQNIDSIFDMFNRADNAWTHKGSGVGLTLVKRIMDRLGGTIKISSVKSRSTKIDLYFPLVESFPETMLKNI